MQHAPHHVVQTLLALFGIDRGHRLGASGQQGGAGEESKDSNWSESFARVVLGSSVSTIP
jgi:hypothetical protein